MEIEKHIYVISNGPNENGLFTIPSVSEIPERYHGSLVECRTIEWYTTKNPIISEDWDTIMYI